MLPSPKNVETSVTDVLVVGGGVAGHRAAAAAARLGERVLVTHIARGASPFLLGCNAPIGTAGHPDSPEVFAADMLEAGAHLNECNLVQALTTHALAAFHDLEALGVPFPRDANGHVLLRHLSGNSCARSLYVPTGTGRAILKALSVQCRQLGVKFWSGWQALALLTMDGEVGGALLVELSTGAMRAVLAGAVVLASGGIGQLYEDSTYPGDVNADSCALALRAGATLIDVEFVQFEPLIVVHPAGCRGMEIPTAMLGDGAHLLNADGERFMFRYNPGHGERLIEKARMASCIQREIDAGRGLSDGTVWADTTVIPPEKLEGYVTHCQRLRAAGLDPARERPRIRPAAHSHMGGVRIDADGWTGVPGLYAGGEAAGGAHGASRIAGNGGSDALVFGALAGQAAALRARALWHRPQAQRAVDDARALLAWLLGGAGCAEAREVIATVRRTMSRHVGLRRDEKGLNSAASRLGALEVALGSTSAVTDVPLAVGLKLASARNMVITARTIVEASLARTESRGSHLRLDFPDRDDAGWLRHLVCRPDTTCGYVLESVPINRGKRKADR